MPSTCVTDLLCVGSRSRCSLRLGIHADASAVIRPSRFSKAVLQQSTARRECGHWQSRRSILKPERGTQVPHPERLRSACAGSRSAVAAYRNAYTPVAATLHDLHDRHGDWHWPSPSRDRSDFFKTKFVLKKNIIRGLVRPVSEFKYTSVEAPNFRLYIALS